MKKLLLILFFIFSSSLAAKNQNGTWLGTFSKKQLSETYSYWIETQVRYNTDLGNTSQILYRTGLLQKVSQSEGVGYLYGYIQSGNTREHRFTVQHTQKYGQAVGLSFSHRARFESRYLEKTTQTYETAGRFRYLLRAEQDESSGYNLVLWDEIFLNLNETEWNGDQTNDRNRFFIGFKRKFLESNRVEFGYLNQFVARESGGISEHIATLYVFF